MKLRRPRFTEWLMFIKLAVIVEALVVIISKMQGAWVPDGRILLGLYIIIIPIIWDTVAEVINELED